MFHYTYPDTTINKNFKRKICFHKKEIAKKGNFTAVRK